MTDSMGPGKLVRHMKNPLYTYTNTWYASDWDQAYRPSYEKIRRKVVRHIQVHLYSYFYNYDSAETWQKMCR